MSKKKQTNIIGKVLPAALQLWLRTQLEEVEGLELKITGGDEQILRGYVPGVSLSCTRAVYEGIHVGAVQLTAENIRINLGQLLRGKPLRLLEPVTVKGNLEVGESALNASVQSPLLSGGLTDLLAMVLSAGGISEPETILAKSEISWSSIALDVDKFNLKGTLKEEKGEIIAISIRSGLLLVDGRCLRLHPLFLDGFPQFKGLEEPLEVDLGEQVQIEDLSLDLGELSCSGSMVIVSEEKDLEPSDTISLHLFGKKKA